MFKVKKKKPTLNYEENLSNEKVRRLFKPVFDAHDREAAKE
jgi:hypothetical protein